MTTRLTKKKAQELIKRETGITASKLEAPSSMNQDSKFPYFEVTSGSLHINVHSGIGALDQDLIALSIETLNSVHTITDYFYADTLEHAAEMTQYQYWNDLFETVQDTDPETVRNRYLEFVKAANRQHDQGKN